MPGKPMHRRTRLSKISALRRNRDAFGVSKELFCGLPQLWECAHCEIEKKRTDRILTEYAPVQEPVSLYGLRFTFFPRSPLPFFAAPLCQTSFLINGAGQRQRTSSVGERQAPAEARNAFPDGKISSARALGWSFNRWRLPWNLLTVLDAFGTTDARLICGETKTCVRQELPSAPTKYLKPFGP